MTEITHEVIAKRVRLARKGGLILALILGLIVAVGRANVYQDATHMLATGTVTEASIVQKRHWLEEGRKGREYDRYAVTYEFSDNAGQANSKEVRVDESYFSEVNEGDPISVIYEAADPATNDTKAQYERMASITNIVRDVILLVIIVIVAGFAIGFLVDKKMRKQMSAQALAQNT